MCLRQLGLEADQFESRGTALFDAQADILFFLLQRLDAGIQHLAELPEMQGLGVGGDDIEQQILPAGTQRLDGSFAVVRGQRLARHQLAAAVERQSQCQADIGNIPVHRRENARFADRRNEGGVGIAGVSRIQVELGQMLAAGNVLLQGLPVDLDLLAFDRRVGLGRPAPSPPTRDSESAARAAFPVERRKVNNSNRDKGFIIASILSFAFSQTK